MKPKQLLTTIFIFIISFASKAQDGQPFKSIGKKVKVLTLSKGKYIEFFDYDTIQRMGTVLYNIRTKKIVKLLNADKTFEKFSDNSSASRWYSPDPLAYKYFSSSPYNFVDNNPISRIDPTGKNWFYYQGKGEEEKSWHWQKGNKASYTNTDGNKASMKSNFTSLVKFVITGRDNISGAKARGDLIVYGNSDKPIFTSRAFSGQKNIFSANVDELPKGNYIMNLTQRDDGKKMGWNAAKDGPAAFLGIQQIPDNTILRNGKDGEDYNVNDHYGGGRIRLNPPSGNLVADGQSTADRGFYLHGRDNWLDETHGCVCNRSLEVFNYFWGGAGRYIRGSVPFSVEEEK